MSKLKKRPVNRKTDRPGTKKHKEVAIIVRIAKVTVTIRWMNRSCWKKPICISNSS